MLIGLTGKRGAGKDALGGALVEDFGFHRVAFADALKDALLAMNPDVVDSRGFSRSLSYLVACYGWDNAKARPEVRRLLQRGGMALRAQDEMVWCRIGMSRADALCARGEDVVVTDVRFLNEARAIRKRGGLLVRIERTDYDVVDTHVSETELDGYGHDIVVRNTPGRTTPGELAALLLDEGRAIA